MNDFSIVRRLELRDSLGRQFQTLGDPQRGYD